VVAVVDEADACEESAGDFDFQSSSFCWLHQGGSTPLFSQPSLGRYVSLGLGALPSGRGRKINKTEQKNKSLSRRGHVIYKKRGTFAAVTHLFIPDRGRDVRRRKFSRAALISFPSSFLRPCLT
jgi:hypothetical protein